MGFVVWPGFGLNSVSTELIPSEKSLHLQDSAILFPQDSAANAKGGSSGKTPVQGSVSAH